MSTLHRHVEDYLAVRRAMGFKLAAYGNLLGDFVDHLERTGASGVTIEAALSWATRPQGVQPYRWKQRLSAIRGFAIYLHALEPATEIPPADLLAYRRQRPTPFVFSDTEITALLTAAGELVDPLRASTHCCLFGLIAATGMRCGEALGLDRDDVDFDTGVVTIRLTKFNKSRQLPLHPSTLEALRRYLHERDRLHRRVDQPSLFISTVGTRLTDRRVRAVFAALVERAGLEPRFGSGRPTIHDLRHSFTVATLLDWYRDGSDVAAKMPLLSAYLGHVSPASTYWYLQATPELLGFAAQRLEQPVMVQR